MWGIGDSKKLKGSILSENKQPCSIGSREGLFFLFFAKKWQNQAFFFFSFLCSRGYEYRALHAGRCITQKRKTWCSLCFYLQCIGELKWCYATKSTKWDLYALDHRIQWSDSLHILGIICTGSVGVHEGLVFIIGQKSEYKATWNLGDFLQLKPRNGLCTR